ncbi:type II secretion system F family protein [Agromyces endophyticus]|uniref:type II secretion system F family protein n=1 Tax=Agromyces sp. H17E-10 TaxID=2932244 RepID=UPI001FD1B7B5|nr:type II secretion system F family protein [Agromyces sp. H17E-10]UOQ89953.1 type II secretion system F family protein [Agromyces sp. H17E-10]
MKTRLRLRPRIDPGAEVDAVAGITERLAVLLAAGVPAATAWRHVAIGRNAADEQVLAAAATAAGEGDDIAEAIRRACEERPGTAATWAVLAAAWSVAAEAGAPLAASLRSLAAVLRDEAQLRRDVATALAGPAASARLVSALPVVALGFGAMLGFDTIGILLGNPLGLACLVLGSLFLWVGARWNRRLARSASASRADAGLELELLAIAMSSGASIQRARALALAAMQRHLPRVAGDGTVVDDVVGLAERAGAPVAELLRAEAFRVRRAARTDGESRAAALGVRLMLPLGACVLPAFVLLGVAPLMISVVTGTLGGAM